MILVTGGTGLVGAHLLIALLRNEEKVRAVYRTGSSIDKAKKTFKYYGNSVSGSFKNIEWIKADVTNIHSLEPAFLNVKTVYHCAALVSFIPKEKKMLFENNILGTANIVNLSLEYNVEAFCHVSSVASIGKQNQREISELNEFDFSEKSSNYSYSKYASEKEVWRGIVEGLNAVIINPSVILGPGDWKNGAGSMFDKIAKGLSFYTSGMTGFIDVQDVVKIMIGLVEKKIFNERFILSENNYFYKEIFSEIAKALNTKPPKIKINPFIMSLACRIEAINSLITGTRPVITKESARPSFRKTKYSNKKIRDELGIVFTPVFETIKTISNFYLQDNMK